MNKLNKHVLDEESVHEGDCVNVGDCSMTVGLEQLTSHWKVENQPEFVHYDSFHLVMTIQDMVNSGGETTIKAYNVKRQDLDALVIALQHLSTKMLMTEKPVESKE
jgi:hypothetical protein